MREPLADVHAAHVLRLSQLDPLLRVPALDLEGEQSVLWSHDQEAAAVVDTRTTDPDTGPGLWVDDHIVRVQLRCASDVAALNAADLLLRSTRVFPGLGPVHLAVAARDTALIRPLLMSGFACTAVLAARRLTDADAWEPPQQTFGEQPLVVREAGMADLAVVVAAGVSVQAFDARVGTLPIRPGAADVLRPGLERALRDRPGWTWVVELDGAPVGVCQLEPPEDAQWVAGEVTSPSPAYLASLHVDPLARRSGAGSMLIAAAHRRAMEAGVRTVLLHYGANNPLSAPFWGRAGYRPVVTAWARQPNS